MTRVKGLLVTNTPAYWARSSVTKEMKCCEYSPCGLYYQHITIVNDDSILTLQVAASPTIVILMTLELSFMLLANIDSTGVTHDDCHETIVIYL